MSRSKDTSGGPKGLSAIEGVLAGFSRLIERLEEVSQAGRERTVSRTFPVGRGDSMKRTKGVFGVSLKVGLGDKGKVTVEPFGNVRRDQATGEPLVEEEREPLVDVFDEEDEILIVAEMPGVEAEDVRAKVDGTHLMLTAERGERKYRKELELSARVRSEIEKRGQNGIIELRARRR